MGRLSSIVVMCSRIAGRLGCTACLFHTLTVLKNTSPFLGLRVLRRAFPPLSSACTFDSCPGGSAAATPGNRCWIGGWVGPVESSLTDSVDS